jgi:hypothetical protein
MFVLVIAAFFAATPQIQNCLDERFLDNEGAFALATPSADASLIHAESGERVPIDPSHQWIAGQRDGDRVCVTDGHLFGWTETSKITLGPLPSPPRSAWLGRWEFAYSGGEPWIQIRRRKDGKLHVTGYAEWRAHPDSTPNLGDLDFTGLPRGMIFDDAGGEVDCGIRMMLLGDRLLAKDNGHCGGMNVNFTTMYARVHR